MSDAADDDKKKIDKFELASAILLGLAAVGAAWAAYQGDLWGGQSVEGYADANKLSTQAESAYNRAATEAERDTALDIQAKQAILTALNTKDTDDGTRELNITIAAYLYQHQLSEEGYKELGLPAGYVRGGDDDAAPAAPGGATDKQPTAGRDDARAEKADSKADDEDEAPAATPAPAAAPAAPAAAADEGKTLSFEQLTASLDQELGDDHWEKMVGATLEMSDAADKRFKEGQRANEVGDKFGLTSVIYALCLFMAGIGLVVKNKVKWGFYAVGVAAFAVATFQLVRTPWAG